MISNCLSYHQLKAYSTQRIEKSEREKLYMHISSCELCACAVNGFTAISFESDEVVAIHREIDSKLNATSVSPLTFAQFIIMAVSFASIAGMCYLPDYLSNNKNRVFENKVVLTKEPLKNETENPSKEEISSVTKTFKKIINQIQYQKFERKITPLERLDLMEPIHINEGISEVVNMANDIISSHYNADAIYIYDLKITSYNKLYFNNFKEEPALLSSYVPASKESKSSVEEDHGIQILSLPADRVLKNGLAAFNKQYFNTALENFNLLLEYNPGDVNAQFYSALSYYNLNSLNKTSEYLKRVITNQNTAFYPEAQWYLALITLKAGDKENARLQLEKIVGEKGFYQKKAKEKLKTL